MKNIQKNETVLEVLKKNTQQNFARNSHLLEVTTKSLIYLSNKPSQSRKPTFLQAILNRIIKNLYTDVKGQMKVWESSRARKSAGLLIKFL